MGLFRKGASPKTLVFGELASPKTFAFGEAPVAENKTFAFDAPSAQLWAALREEAGRKARRKPFNIFEILERTAVSF